MITDDRFGRALSTWLHDEAGHRVPDHLGEVLVQTVATHQRPWWSSPERWLPLMDTVAPRRVADPRPILGLALIGAVLLALIGVAVVGTRPSSESPAIAFGTAQNGRLFIAAGTEVRSYAPDGTDDRLVRTVPEGVRTLAISPNGRRLAMYVAEQRHGAEAGRIDILDLDDDGIVEVRPPAGFAGGDQMDWSPDGTRLVFPGFGPSGEHLFIARTDDGSVTELGPGAIDHGQAVGWADWSPDGEWIAFAAVDPESFVGPILRIKPDGTGLDEVVPDGQVGEIGDIRWSPDPAVERLLMMRGTDILLWDAATDETSVLDQGFWPSWSSDGTKVGFWTGGPVVGDLADAPFTPDELQARFTGFGNGACQDHPELSGLTICSIPTWSPDGTLLVGPDIVGPGVVIASALEPGGDPVELADDLTVEGLAWQPVAP